MEALKGDSEGEDRRPWSGAPGSLYWSRLLDAPTRLCRRKPGQGLWACLETLCVGPFMETATSWWGALLVPGGLGGWRGPHQMIR